MVKVDRWAREEIPGFPDRLALRPGITGLAQVRQGTVRINAETYAEKLRLNERYRDRLGLMLDLQILASTVMPVLIARPYDVEEGPRPNASASVRSGARAAGSAARSTGRSRAG